MGVVDNFRMLFDVTLKSVVMLPTNCKEPHYHMRRDNC